jgi:hypothetical protein
MRSILRSCLFLIAIPFAGVLPAVAQGTLEDYQRAQNFLPGNLHHKVFTGEVAPNWIEKTDRFWYRSVGPNGTEFILVDAAQNTSAPAFDHARLAEALSSAAHRTYAATELPFDTFEFVEDAKAIRFDADDSSWTCQLSSYECKPGRGHRGGRRAGRTGGSRRGRSE